MAWRGLMSVAIVLTTTIPTSAYADNEAAAKVAETLALYRLSSVLCNLPMTPKLGQLERHMESIAPTEYRRGVEAGEAKFNSEVKELGAQNVCFIYGTSHNSMSKTIEENAAR
jgi:hypothetical protein